MGPVSTSQEQMPRSCQPSGSSKSVPVRESAWETISGWDVSCSTVLLKISVPSFPSTLSPCRVTGTEQELTPTSPPLKCVCLVSTRPLPFTTSVPVLPTEDVQSESPGMLLRGKRVTLRTGGHHPTATHTRSQRSWSKLAASTNKLFDIKAIFILVTQP